jgi:hypothetical protein
MAPLPRLGAEIDEAAPQPGAHRHAEAATMRFAFRSASRRSWLAESASRKEPPSGPLSARQSPSSRAMERLRENVERAMQLRPALDPQGNPTGEHKHDASAANRIPRRSSSAVVRLVQSLRS